MKNSAWTSVPSLCLWLCLCASLCVCEVAEVPMVASAESDICAGKEKSYRIHIIEAYVAPYRNNCTYIFNAITGSCGVMTWPQQPVNDTYLCYNTDVSICLKPDNVLYSNVTRVCAGESATFGALPVQNYLYKSETPMISNISAASVYVDVSCEGVPFTPPRRCAFAYSLPITGMLFALLAILLL